MTTANQIMDRARRELLAGWREPVNKLAVDLDPADTEVQTAVDIRMTPGMVIEVGDELMYVWSTAPNGMATVERGWLGTTPAAHVVGTLTWANPRFTRVAMLDALNSELVDLTGPHRGLFRIKTLEVHYQNFWQGYDLTGAEDLMAVQDVWQRFSTREWLPVHSWDVTRKMPTTDFPSQLMLRIKDPIFTNGPIRLSYRAPFGTVAAPTDELTDDTIGAWASLDDILALGIQIRLMSPREVKRNFNETQGEPRRQEEVPPGATTNSMAALRVLHDQRVTAEAMRLHRIYPILLRTQ